MSLKKNAVIAALFAASLGAALPATAAVAGRSTLGVTVEQEQLIVNGWSVKKSVLGKDVYNDQNEKIGKVEDVIVAPDKSLSFAVIGVGGFLGVARHDVAIPVDQFTTNDGKFVLTGASKDALKALPKFEYEKQPKKIQLSQL